MLESAKDLSTTSFGLIAAYVLPGAIVLGALGWLRPSVGEYLLKNLEGFSLAFAAALVISLLLNGFRTAVFTKWLFSEMCFSPPDLAGVEPGRVGALQAAIDEVRRLEQFYSSLFFLFLLICLEWLTKEWHRIPLWSNILVLVGSIVTWRVIAISLLDNFEHYHQITRGILGATSPANAVANYKARIIGILFLWKFWDKYGQNVNKFK